jgi:hypothetical protein
MVWFDGNLRHRALQNHEKSSFSLSLSLSLVFLIEIKEEKNFCGSLEPYSSIYGVIIVVFVLKSGSLVKGYRLYRRRWNRKHIWSLGSVLKAWIKQLEQQQPGNKRRSNMIPMVVMEAIVYALDYTQWRFLSYISSLFPTSCLFSALCYLLSFFTFTPALMDTVDYPQSPAGLVSEHGRICRTRKLLDYSLGPRCDD